MKKFQKNITKIFTTIITMMIILVSANKVNAAENTIQLGDAHYAGNYIAGVYFTDKTTKDGKYLYCLDLPKNTAANITANLVRDSKYIDGGLIYILANGYPEKSITKDNQKDYYITQTAVWWYLDEVYGTSNLGNEFKTTGDDSSNLRKYVKQLVEDGKKHKNDSTTLASTKLTISTNDISMKLKDDYYESDYIKASNSENITTYKVSLSGTPKGTLIEKNGGVIDYNGEFEVKSTESFIIKVPKESVSNNEITIKVNAKAVGKEQYMAYEYQPTDKSMQNVALLEKNAISVTDSLELKLTKKETPVISIKKVDQDTQQALAGAILVIKNSKGEIVYKFETTKSPEIITEIVDYDTYTVEELSAPEGYMKSDRTVSFTIDENHLSHQIIFENTKEVYVPNTANTSSIIMVILGILITGAGIKFVYSNRKKA